MEYAGLEALDGTPKNISSLDATDLENIIGCFVDEYVMVEFDVEKELWLQKEQAQQPRVNNNQTAPLSHQEPPTQPELAGTIKPRVIYYYMYNISTV